MGTSRKELREFQFIIQPVLLLYNGDGPPRPIHADPVVRTGLEELRAFIDAFPGELETLNENLPE